MARAIRPRRAGRLGRYNPGHVPLFGGSPAGRAACVEATVGGDPVEPGAERGAFLEPSEALPGGQQRVLHGVLAILEGIRASGSSAPGALGGGAQSVLGRRRCPRPAPWRSGRLSSLIASPS